MASETWDEYWDRANTSVDIALTNANIERWDLRILELQWNWAGHVARLPMSHAARQIRDYRDILWGISVNRPLAKHAFDVLIVATRFFDGKPECRSMFALVRF